MQTNQNRQQYTVTFEFDQSSSQDLSQAQTQIQQELQQYFQTDSQWSQQIKSVQVQPIS